MTTDRLPRQARDKHTENSKTSVQLIGKVHGMAERNVEVCEQTLLCLFLMNVDHLLRQAREM